MNKVMIVGRLVEDARPIKGGAVFTVAVNSDMKSKFIPAVTFNDKVTMYLAKGRLVSLDAHIEVSRKDNKSRIVIVADSVSLLDAKKTVNNASKFEDKVMSGETADVPAFASRS